MKALLALLALWLAFSGIVGVAARAPSETAGLVLEPVTPEMSTAYVMHSRPFVLPDHLSPAFDFETLAKTPISEANARQALERFLVLRNMPTDRVAAVVGRFDSPAIV